MNSIKRILLTVSLPALVVYGSFVGVWTPTGLDGYTAEQLGADCAKIRCCESTGVTPGRELR